MGQPLYWSCTEKHDPQPPTPTRALPVEVSWSTRALHFDLSVPPARLGEEGSAYRASWKETTPPILIFLPDLTLYSPKDEGDSFVHSPP